jgi:PAS domain S-box-containing protein
MIGDDLDDEGERQRSMAIQNCSDISAARERADDSPRRSKEALESKVASLTRSLALVRSTLESTADAIVVADRTGTIIDYNEKYVRMWHHDAGTLRGRDHHELVREMSEHFENRAAFLERVASIYAADEQESYDVLRIPDGRVVERFSRPLFVDGGIAGRVWSFHDISEKVRIQESLSEQTHVLEVLNQTGIAVAAELDAKSSVQTVTDAAREVTGAQFAAFLHHTTNERADSFSLRTLSAATDFPLPRGAPIFEATFRGQRILRVADVLEHPVYGQGMPRDHASIRSYLAVPVVARSGEVYGGLFLGHGQPEQFSERHESFVSALAAQAAIAIDNARLFEAAQQAREQLQALNEALEVRVLERTAALRRSEQQFQQLVAGVTDCAIYMLDPGGHVASWNSGAERIKGYTAEEIIGQHFGAFYTEQDRAAGKPSQSLVAALRDGKYEAEAWRIRKDGTHFWASVLIDPIRGADGTLIGFAKVTRDMTERRAMQEQLHQSQKMEAIGQLTGGVAHDFNNLLTVILGNLETLWRHIPADDGRLQRAADQATRGAQRAATLTQQLLAFSRRQPLNPKPTDVNRLVTGMSDLIRRTLSENISVETVLAGGLWRVEVDPHQLESALLNLAVNSRDAMPNGGKLTVETANAHLDENYAARFAEIAPGQYVVICVTDSGVGMTSEVLAHAFDPFFTTKPIGEGTGLGLSQVFGFVKQSGGHVKLYSEAGQGTTVKIYLPRMTGDAPLPEPEPAPVIARGHSSETILVVEDDDDVRSYSTESLRELGFTVLEASDGPTALRVLERHPEVKLLFTDVGLPGFNGRELVSEARRRWPELKVLFTSGYARNAIVHQGRLDHGVELLTKPFTRAQLAARIRDVLDAKSATPAGRRVALVVEDEPLIRMLLVDVLEQLGFTVEQAGSAQDGLSLAARIGSVAVAFVDIGLPDRSGLELAAELRERWPTMAIANASGYGEQVPGKLHGAARVTFLRKPFDAAGISQALKAVGLKEEAARAR